MNNNTNLDERLVQGAKAWNEREEHAAIMEKLKEIDYTVTETVLDEDIGDYYAGECFYHYHPHILPLEELESIVRRGNHEEIMFMISRFDRFSKHYDMEQSSFLPASIQKLLVERNDAEEIEAIIRRYGFSEPAQDVMFAKWPHQQLVAYGRRHGFCDKWQKFIIENWSDAEINEYSRRHAFSAVGMTALLNSGHHEEIMEHINRHGIDMSVYPLVVQRGNHDEIMAVLHAPYNRRSYNRTYEFDAVLKRGNHDEIMATLQNIYYYSCDFKPEMQKQVWKRGNEEEIALMLQRIELCNDLLDEMFDALESGKGKLFTLYAQNTKNGLPVTYQKRLIKNALPEQFLQYIAYQGFYEEVHAIMVSLRSRDEIRRYLERHKYLSSEAEDLFIYKGTEDDKVFYYQNKPQDTESFLNKLLKSYPLDYGALSTILLSLTCWKTEDETVIQLMKSGDAKDVKAYFKQCKILGRKAFLTLFFRMDNELLDAYLQGRDKFFE